MNTWILVPVRGLASGKSRLAAVVSADERRALNAQMLDRTLEAIAQSGEAPELPRNPLAQCIVVSADADVLDLARLRGAQALDEGRNTGLNAALELARAKANAQGATRLLVLAADIPEVDAAALERLDRAIPANSAAVISDKIGTGTNGLLLPARANICFAFGVDSLVQHRTALEALGIDTRIWHDPALAFDLDTAADYAAWTSLHATAH
ncbi:MAG: 2-phospho-L-lactate guanylyltransferase [Burkholderiales bacterium]|nr:2-phospho-L-lactate guanylyltransferase [Burkholderiales bacterium]